MNYKQTKRNENEKIHSTSKRRRISIQLYYNIKYNALINILIILIEVYMSGFLKPSKINNNTKKVKKKKLITTNH